MKAAPFDYHAPCTLSEALELLALYGPDARVIAGGQSLVPMLALRLARPEVLVDLNRIPGLAGIREQDETIRIGAMTRQAHALASPLIREKLPLLHFGLSNVGHPPTRARGTLGGSLSHADPAAEIPAVMLGYQAQLVLASVQGERTVDASDFTAGTFETCLDEGEILKEILVPVPPAEGTAFVELSRRKGDFAMASAAARLSLDENGDCRSAHLVVGAVAPVPLRCDAAAAALVGRPVTGQTVEEALALIDMDQFEFDNPDISLAYRRHIGPVLARRALTQAFERAQGLHR
jgi:carbon-monoxide dehydrogenase medium subunit